MLTIIWKEQRLLPVHTYMLWLCMPIYFIFLFYFLLALNFSGHFQWEPHIPKQWCLNSAVITSCCRASLAPKSSFPVYVTMCITVCNHPLGSFPPCLCLKGHGKHGLVGLQDLPLCKHCSFWLLCLQNLSLPWGWCILQWPRKEEFLLPSLLHNYPGCFAACSATEAKDL